MEAAGFSLKKREEGGKRERGERKVLEGVVIRLVLSPVPLQRGGEGPESVQRIGNTEGDLKASQVRHTWAHRESGQTGTVHWGKLEVIWEYL